MAAEDLEQVNMHEAKTHLSRLVERVEDGEEIVISRAGKPAAKLVPMPKKLGPRKLGGWEGKVQLSPDFYEFDKEIEQMFEESAESDLFPPEDELWRGD